MRVVPINLEDLTGEWFDLWHCHPDFYGDGNASAVARRQSLALTREAFMRVRRHMATTRLEYQCWAIVDPEDAGQDSVYIHTANPNGSAYPYEFDDVDWAAVPPAWLEAIFDTEHYQIGVSATPEGCLYWIIAVTP